MPAKDILEPMGIYDEEVDKLCSRQFNENIQKLDKEKINELLSKPIMYERAKFHSMELGDHNLIYDPTKSNSFQRGFLQARNIILNYLENDCK